MAKYIRNPDAVPQLFCREIILAEQVEVARQPSSRGPPRRGAPSAAIIPIQPEMEPVYYSVSMHSKNRKARLSYSLWLARVKSESPGNWIFSNENKEETQYCILNRRCSVTRGLKFVTKVAKPMPKIGACQIVAEFRKNQDVRLMSVMSRNYFWILATSSRRHGEYSRRGFHEVNASECVRSVVARYPCEQANPVTQIGKTQVNTRPCRPLRAKEKVKQFGSITVSAKSRKCGIPQSRNRIPL